MLSSPSPAPPVVPSRSPNEAKVDPNDPRRRPLPPTPATRNVTSQSVNFGATSSATPAFEQPPPRRKPLPTGFSNSNLAAPKVRTRHKSDPKDCKYGSARARRDSSPTSTSTSTASTASNCQGQSPSYQGPPPPPRQKKRYPSDPKDNIYRHSVVGVVPSNPMGSQEWIDTLKRERTRLLSAPTPDDQSPTSPEIETLKRPWTKELPLPSRGNKDRDDAKDEDSKAISRSRLSSSRDMRTGTEPLPPLPSKSTSCDRPSRPTTPSPRPRNASRSRSRSRCASPDGRGGKEEGKEEKQGIRGASSRPVSWASPEMAPKLFKRLNGLEAGTLRQTAANSTKGVDVGEVLGFSGGSDDSLNEHNTILKRPALPARGSRASDIAHVGQPTGKQAPPSAALDLSTEDVVDFMPPRRMQAASTLKIGTNKRNSSSSSESSAGKVVLRRSPNAKLPMPPLPNDDNRAGRETHNGKEVSSKRSRERSRSKSHSRDPSLDFDNRLSIPQSGDFESVPNNRRSSPNVDDVTSSKTRINKTSPGVVDQNSSSSHKTAQKTSSGIRNSESCSSIKKSALKMSSSREFAADEVDKVGRRGSSASVSVSIFGGFKRKPEPAGVAMLKDNNQGSSSRRSSDASRRSSDASSKKSSDVNQHVPGESVKKPALNFSSKDPTPSTEKKISPTSAHSVDTFLQEDGICGTLTRSERTRTLRFGEKQQVEIHYGSFGLYAETSRVIMDLAAEYVYSSTRPGGQNRPMRRRRRHRQASVGAETEVVEDEEELQAADCVDSAPTATQKEGDQKKQRRQSWNIFKKETSNTQQTTRRNNQETNTNKRDSKALTERSTSQDAAKESTDVKDEAEAEGAATVSVSAAGSSAGSSRPNSWQISMEELRFVQNATDTLSRKSDGGETTDSEDDLLSVHSRSVMSLVEEFNRQVPEMPDENNKQNVPYLIRFAASQYMGLVFGPLFGILVYVFLLYLVLTGLPLGSIFRSDSEGAGTETGAARTAREVANDTTHTLTTSPSTTAIQNNIYTGFWTDRNVAQVISGTCGIISGSTLTIGGRGSARIRATMVLLVPTLLSKRGRAFMLTSAFAILLTGPVHTIEMNIQEVVESLTCLYEQMKDMASDFVQQVEDNFQQMNQTLTDMNNAIVQYQRRMQELQQKSSEAVTKEMQELQAKMQVYQQKLSRVQKFMAKTSTVCDSVVAVTTFGIVDNCGTPAVPNLPNLNLNISFDQSFTFVDPSDLVEFESKTGEIHATPINEIRDNLKTILSDVFATISRYFKYISKFCYLSVLFMLWDAVHYMYKYYTDDSFDNLFVDHNLRYYAKNIQKDESLLPMRNWELNEKYQVQTAVKLSKKEYKRIFMQSLGSIIFSAVAIAVVIADIVLRAVLQVFRDEAQFGIQYDGMEQGVTLKSLGQQSPEQQMNVKFKMFDLSSDPCLPTPHNSDYTRMIAIVGLVLACFLSCVFDAYATRLRSTVCNACFPKRATERVAFLYRRIVTGRSTRRLQLQMIAYRRLEKKYREAEFFHFHRGEKHKRETRTKLSNSRSRTVECAGCAITINKREGTKFPVKIFGEDATVYICCDCKKDTNLR